MRTIKRKKATKTNNNNNKSNNKSNNNDNNNNIKNNNNDNDYGVTSNIFLTKGEIASLTFIFKMPTSKEGGSP